MTDYIEPIKEQIDKNLHEHCVRFINKYSYRITFNRVTLSRRLHDTPRWYNIHSFCEDTKTLTIASTQCYFIKLSEEPDPNKTKQFFKIDCSDIKEFEDFDYTFNWSEFWEQFREYRTKFLKKHYSNIDHGY